MLGVADALYAKVMTPVCLFPPHTTDHCTGLARCVFALGLQTWGTTVDKLSAVQFAVEQAAANEEEGEGNLQVPPPRVV